MTDDTKSKNCVFIEDTALVINSSHVVITRPGAPSRQPEPGPVADELRCLGFERVDALAAPATLDGGDVQILPWAVLVGTSKRTNEEAVAQLRTLLAEAGGPPVFAFSVGAATAAAGAGASTLHFKSVLSALDPHTLLVADTPVGRALADQIRAVPELAGKLELEFLPDAIAANVLSIGRHCVMQAGKPASEAILRRLCEARGMELHTLCMGELAKADGALTCCSILFEAPDKQQQQRSSSAR
ncbi:hypothetical protein GPECTOR_7g1153 [Gonium pectorale]|uniref:Uncharacterized protein n=1 Tax=Gonium pectorale TaxID=33097 RepID=A0A150GTU9_GONPE|nr:hypothetical protein GPECTOR_7g1153 [Gonium pectorale]|eukprot:KXZ53259.1 hypothetical protein GPECTOR_7g1153 [Gonium pectorale]